MTFPVRIAPLLAILACVAWATAAQAQDWKPVPDQDLLVMDTSRGRLTILLRPDFAPLAVERILRLSREGVYDGLLFHRVIPGFVAQTGNPDNRDGGVSAHPDLPPEFTFRTEAKGFAAARRTAEGSEGFLGPSPVVLDGKGRGWGAYCTGVAGMGRQEGIRTANSEIFFMLAPARRLDHDYTVWGRVVEGLDVLAAIAPGEPPAAPDRMVRVRPAGDLPEADRPRLEMMEPTGPVFMRRLADARRARGADLGLCDLQVPVRPRRGP
ncbi:MAG: peptidylprolyl isomerase [Phenylobacterium sp.]